MFRLSRLMRAASDAASSSGSGAALLAAVASRLPEKGLSSSHLHALLEDEFPLFTPGSVGALSLLEALQMHPALFSVSVDGALGSWSVQRATTTSASPRQATVEPASEPSPDSARSSDVYDRLCAYLHGHSVGGRHGHGFVPLEVALREIGCDKEVDLADLLTTQSARQQVETDLSLHIKLTRSPRAGIIFVDGSELPATAVNDMCEALCLIKERSTVFIARHAHHTPLSELDAVAPSTVPLYLAIEKKAHQLAQRSPLVLQDVIYMCSARQFSTYANHVAGMNGFPDADVYVCCPSRIQLVQPKTLVPLFDDDEAAAVA